MPLSAFTRTECQYRVKEQRAPIEFVSHSPFFERSGPPLLFVLRCAAVERANEGIHNRRRTTCLLSVADARVYRKSPG